MLRKSAAGGKEVTAGDAIVLNSDRTNISTEKQEASICSGWCDVLNLDKCMAS